MKLNEQEYFFVLNGLAQWTMGVNPFLWKLCFMATFTLELHCFKVTFHLQVALLFEVLFSYVFKIVPQKSMLKLDTYFLLP